MVPKILNKENIVMAACTGSGKTLAYTLPMVQNLAEQEKQGGVYMHVVCTLRLIMTHPVVHIVGYIRHAKRPRCLVLVPTRELASQVLQEVRNDDEYESVRCGDIHECNVCARYR